MGLLESVRSAIDTIGPATDDRSRLAGAYWCDDCSVRLPVTEDELDDRTPTCPDCGDLMRFERSPESGNCAC